MIEVNNELILQYQPLMHKIANKYAIRLEDREDLVQEFSIKLIKCVEKFDESKGVPFFYFFRTVCENCAKDWLDKEIKILENTVNIDYVEEIDLEQAPLDLSEFDSYTFDKFKNKCENHPNGNLAKQKYIDNLTIKEIATKYNISKQSAEKRINKFLSWLSENWD